MTEKEMLEQKLKILNDKKNNLTKEKKELIENNPEVKRYVRLSYEERKTEREILKLKNKIKDEMIINCNHAYINTCSNELYCLKCGYKATPDYVEQSGSYKKVKDNFEIINTRYACDEVVITKIISYILESNPSISDDDLVHYVAVALHNMQTKDKSDNVKRGRAKRLYIRPVLLKSSKML